MEIIGLLLIKKPVAKEEPFLFLVMGIVFLQGVVKICGVIVKALLRVIIFLKQRESMDI